MQRNVLISDQHNNYYRIFNVDEETRDEKNALFTMTKSSFVFRIIFIRIPIVCDQND